MPCSVCNDGAYIIYFLVNVDAKPCASDDFSGGAAMRGMVHRIQGQTIVRVVGRFISNCLNPWASNRRDLPPAILFDLVSQMWFEAEGLFEDLQIMYANSEQDVVSGVAAHCGSFRGFEDSPAGISEVHTHTHSFARGRQAAAGPSCVDCPGRLLRGVVCVVAST